MTPTQAEIVEFYRGCDYWPAKGTFPNRPRELNIPLFLKRQSEIIDNACKTVINSVIHIDVTSEGSQIFATVLLHEALFHFYKAFYNYLAARSLYFGGMLHWINITLYYAKFYLARSITTLVGLQSYRVTRKTRYDLDNLLFDERISKALVNRKGREPDAYRIRLELVIGQKNGHVLFDKERVSSHQDVWTDYESIDAETIKVYPVTFNPDDLVKERNEENYSFEGYDQLDFNLHLKGFQDYFERDLLKMDANRIFDEASGDVLLTVSSLFRLFYKLQVEQLPLEKGNLLYMIEYCMPESEAKERLKLLCEEGFPTQELFSEDGRVFCDERGRIL